MRLNGKETVLCATFPDTVIHNKRPYVPKLIIHK